MHVPFYMQNKEKLLEDCQLRKVGLISQVKELQEKLNRLVYSVNFQNIETEGSKRQQPVVSSHASENSLSDSSSDGEETDRAPLVDVFHVDKTPCDLIDLGGSQDPAVENDMSGVPVEDQVDLQDRSLCLQAGFHGSSHDQTPTEGPGPLKNALRAMDLSSWSSPEVVRKDSTLEPVPSLPLTPCSDALSLDASLQDRTSTSLQADQLELLWYLGGSAAGKASRWAESPLAADRAPSADHHVQWMAVVSGLPWVLPWFGVWVAQGPRVFPWECVCSLRYHSCSIVGSSPGGASGPGVCAPLTVPWSAMCRDGHLSAAPTLVCCNMNN